VRTHGFAVNRGEWREQVMGLAAVIHDVSGQVVAAIGISGPAERINQLDLDEMGSTLIGTAQKISRRLGYRG